MSLKRKLINFTLLYQVFISGGFFTNLFSRYNPFSGPSPTNTSCEPTSFPFANNIWIALFTNDSRLKDFAKKHEKYIQQAAHSFVKAIEQMDISGLEKPSDYFENMHVSIETLLKILQIRGYNNYKKASDFLDTKEFFGVLTQVMKQDGVPMPSSEFINDVRKFQIENIYLFVAQIMNAQEIDKLQSLVALLPDYCAKIAKIIIAEAKKRCYKLEDSSLERFQNARTLLGLVQAEHLEDFHKVEFPEEFPEEYLEDFHQVEFAEEFPEEYLEDFNRVEFAEGFEAVIKKISCMSMSDVVQTLFKSDIEEPGLQFIKEAQKIDIDFLYQTLGVVHTFDKIKKMMINGQIAELKYLIEADPDYCAKIAKIVIAEAEKRPDDSKNPSEESYECVKTLLGLVQVACSEKTIKVISCCMSRKDVVNLLVDSGIKGLSNKLEKRSSFLLRKQIGGCIKDPIKSKMSHQYLAIANMLTNGQIDQLRSLIAIDPDYCAKIARIIIAEAPEMFLRPENTNPKRVENVRTLLSLVQVECSEKIIEKISCMDMDDLLDALIYQRMHNKPSKVRIKLSEIARGQRQNL